MIPLILEKAGLKKPGLQDSSLLSDLFVYRDLLAVLAHTLKLDVAVNQCEQGVVFAFSNVSARVNLASALSDEDITGKNKLTVCSLGAEALGFTVTTVLGRAHSFFMCH